MRALICLPFDPHLNLAGPDLATPRIRGDVKIALTLELKRSSSEAAEAYGN